MQGIVRAIRSCQEILKAAILQHSHGRRASKAANLFAFGRITSSSSTQLKGLENVTVAEVLMTKGEEKTGSWLWCRTDDAVIDAVKNVISITFSVAQKFPCLIQITCIEQ